jgi:hypothetical protein
VANVGTWFANLGTSLIEGVSGVTKLATDIAPLVGGVLDFFQPQPSGGSLPGPIRPQRPAAMPGGAPLSTVSTSSFPQRPMQRNVGLLDRALTAGTEFATGGACITPQEGVRVTLPRLVQFQNPMNPNLIETYVRAPKARFKVTVSGPKRRGGR